MPEKLHRKLKARAAAEGKTLSDYLREEIERLSAKPTLKQWADELRKRIIDIEPGISAAEIVRMDRDSR